MDFFQSCGMWSYKYVNLPHQFTEALNESDAKADFSVTFVHGAPN